jgi:hypothetical protein
MMVVVGVDSATTRWVTYYRCGMSDVCDIAGPHFGSGLTIDTAAELYENRA